MLGKDRILPVALLVLYAGAVAFLCFWDFDPQFISGQSELWGLDDKDVHFIMFVPFVILTVWAFRGKYGSKAGYLAFTAGMLALATAAAFGIEAVQALTGYRSADIYDALYGVGGAVTGTVLLFAAQIVIDAIRRNRKNHK